MSNQKKMITYGLCGMFALLFCTSCKSKGPATGAEESQATGETMQNGSLGACPDFQADSAMLYINRQCDFGPRVPDTEAHRLCGDYIVSKFKEFGLQVTEQHSQVTAYNGKKLPNRNIIASVNPDAADRILFCAHWDSRPWADNDADEKNHHTPVLAANDGASGVAVMLEMARLLQQNPVKIGIDFICFDTEDLGSPQWDDSETESENGGWCLGSAYWAQHPHVADYKARFGILLDMVGGKGATFARESFSQYNASSIVDLVWGIAAQLGYGNVFQNREGGAVTDDHISVMKYAHIPCIDIIPNCQNATTSSFGPTWHTVNDIPEHIDPTVLKAVGQTMMQVVCYFESM